MGYIAQNSPRYTCQRNGIFYLYFRLNDGLFFKASLGTDSQRDAKKIVIYLSPYISWLKQGKMEKETLKQMVMETRKINKEWLENYVTQQVAEAHEQIRRIPKDNIASPNRKRTPISIQREDAALGKEVMNTFADDGESFSYIWLKGAKHFNGEYDESITDDDLIDFGSRMDMAGRLLFEAQQAYANHDLIKYNAIVSSLLPPVVPVSSVSESEPVSTAPALKEAWNNFVASRTQWTAEVKRGNQQLYELMACIWGEDRLVDSITKKDIMELISLIESLPNQTRNPYNKMNIAELVEYVQKVKIKPEESIASKTVKEYLKLCQGFFSTYLTKETSVLTVSPTHNMPTYKVKENPHGNYTHSEMKKLITHFSQQTGWHKWLYLLLAYTGARLSEMVDLTIDRVKFDEDSNRHYIFIDKGKTDASKRQIPLHPYLIEQGFLDYCDEMKAQGYDGVLPELRRKDNRVRDYLTKVREQFAIEKNNDYGQPRAVHSFRHTFITAAFRSNAHSHVAVQQVVGHEHTHLDITNRYIHELPVKDLLSVVDCINWHE